MLKYKLMVSVLIFVWLMVAILHLEWIFPQFGLIISWLYPWEGLQDISPTTDHMDNLLRMQSLLDTSIKVSNIAFFSMVSSFIMLTIYLTLVYQQKQKRSRENRMLTLKNQEIARRNEFIQYISATIGHEFKNNLGRIKRRIDLLSDLPPEAKVKIDDNMDKLFADIEIFKTISDKQETGLIDFVNLQLMDILTELSDHFNDLADIYIERQIQPPAIYASQTLMKTVFENLIDNSIKYKKPDQKKASIFVKFSMDQDGRRRYLTIHFKDQGIGMSNWEADQCFYKSKNSEEGWGQGLYFTKYVIGLHAGKIKVGKEHTKPGLGTEIIINLPFVEEDLNV